ncbi:MAG TPA: arsenate reductase ArsC [Candidatus Acidoferrum sp.]|nr:arsenate reductase ArsC [Candidatus Acidoferrum sp.]
MNGRIYNALFICTGNSARSILAEAILNQSGGGRFKAYSAGSHPKGEVNPLAIATLQARNYDTTGLRSKSWDEFAAPGAPRMDFIFTVCDNAAGEVCPLWSGSPVTAHWGFADPAAVEGSTATQQAAFVRTFTEISRRLQLFVSLPIEKLDHLSLQQQLRALGQAR